MNTLNKMRNKFGPRLQVIPHLSSGMVERAKASARENYPTREKATRGGERPYLFCRLSRVGWFSRALALLSLRKKWGTTPSLIWSSEWVKTKNPKCTTSSGWVGGSFFKSARPRGKPCEKMNNFAMFFLFLLHIPQQKNMFRILFKVWTRSLRTKQDYERCCQHSNVFLHQKFFSSVVSGIFRSASLKPQVFVRWVRRSWKESHWKLL